MILVLSNRKAFLQYSFVDGLQVVCSQDRHVRAIRCLHMVFSGLEPWEGEPRSLNYSLSMLSGLVEVSTHYAIV